MQPKFREICTTTFLSLRSYLWCLISVGVVSWVEGRGGEQGDIACGEVHDVHVRRLTLQLLQQLEHVEVGAEVFLVQDKEDRYLQNYLRVKLENPIWMHGIYVNGRCETFKSMGQLEKRLPWM